MANLVDATIPQNSESPTLGAQRIRETRSGFNTLLGVEHDISDDATTKGYHGPNITIPEQASISDPGSNRGRLGVVEVAGVAELHYRDDASGTKQITNAGQLNIVDADGAVVKTGAQTIAGVKTFSDSPIVPTPTTNTQAANKSYADGTPKAQMKANNVQGATYSGMASGSGTDSQGSITHANGMIEKWGQVTTAGSIPTFGNTGTVTFHDAFPNACEVAIYNTGNAYNGGSTVNNVMLSVATGSFTYAHGSNPKPTVIYWRAIGY
jgi:hypothetical protein